MRYRDDATYDEIIVEVRIRRDLEMIRGAIGGAR
jgi:hypothetical protein